MNHWASAPQGSQPQPSFFPVRYQTVSAWALLSALPDSSKIHVMGGFRCQFCSWSWEFILYQKEYEVGIKSVEKARDIQSYGVLHIYKHVEVGGIYLETSCFGGRLLARGETFLRRSKDNWAIATYLYTTAFSIYTSHRLIAAKSTILKIYGKLYLAAETPIYAKYHI